MTDHYPILVDWEGFKGDNAMTIVCNMCLAEKVLTPEELLNEGLYSCPGKYDPIVGQVVHCPGVAVHKYDPADRCPGCKKLGFFSKDLNHCCSRVCMLQAEYQEQLREARADRDPNVVVPIEVGRRSR